MLDPYRLVSYSFRDSFINLVRLTVIHTELSSERLIVKVFKVWTFNYPLWSCRLVWIFLKLVYVNRTFKIWSVELNVSYKRSETGSKVDKWRLFNLGIHFGRYITRQRWPGQRIRNGFKRRKSSRSRSNYYCRAGAKFEYTLLRVF